MRSAPSYWSKLLNVKDGVEVLSRKASTEEVQCLRLTWEANSIAANCRKRKWCDGTKQTRTTF